MRRHAIFFGQQHLSALRAAMAIRHDAPDSQLLRAGNGSAHGKGKAGAAPFLEPWAGALGERPHGDEYP